MSLIDIFFAFYNSGFLFLLLWFVGRKKILPGVEQELHLEKATREGLVDDRTRLAHALVFIDRDRESRDDQYRKLMERVARWVEFEERLQEERDRELHSNYKRYCSRVAKQVDDAQLRSIEKEVLPVALADAEVRLVEHFASAKKREVFVDQAFSSLMGGLNEQ